jgi:lipopolysaccharide/colanic/teichoic acid biosynthesis glycosyltransferase
LLLSPGDADDDRSGAGMIGPSAGALEELLMRSWFGAGLGLSAWAVICADVASAGVAAAVLADLRFGAGGAGATVVGPAIAVACGYLAATALGGLYRRHGWSQPRLLAAAMLRTLALLLLGTLGVMAASGPVAPLSAHLPWVVPVAFVAATGFLRFALAVAPPLAWRVASPSGAMGAAVVEPMPGLASLGEASQMGRGGRIARVGDEFDAGGQGRRPGAGRAARTEEVERRVDLEALPADWLADAAITREGPVARACRRLFDILGSVLLLLLVLPILALTAIAIRLESRGPVFYRQERVGLDGRVFTLFKFRSMTVDAEKDGPCWAVPRDPRVTRVGRLIRLTRIDEIPQVINVLRGEMALIGPRPERPAFVEQLAAVIPQYRDRQAVRPGITGWAQVNYPYGASVEDARNKLAYDLFYIRRRSFLLDGAIILGTIRVVLFQEGAR